MEKQLSYIKAFRSYKRKKFYAEALVFVFLDKIFKYFYYTKEAVAIFSYGKPYQSFNISIPIVLHKYDFIVIKHDKRIFLSCCWRRLRRELSECSQINHLIK